jgi:hypothetical protein
MNDLRVDNSWAKESARKNPRVRGHGDAGVLAVTPRPAGLNSTIRLDRQGHPADGRRACVDLASVEYSRQRLGQSLEKRTEHGLNGSRNT